MRVLIVSENASALMSGETFLPLYYFRKLSERGVTAHLLTHARCRDELRESLSDKELARVSFIEDTAFQHLLWRTMQTAPERIRALLVDQAIHFSSQLRARTLAKQLVREQRLDLVFEPAPISPKGVSCMYDLGVPVVIGPLCGGMELPPAFRYMDPLTARLGIDLGRAFSPLVHRAFPGKLQAETILVGNPRTVAALPAGCRGKVYELPESGVDLSLWQAGPRPREEPGRPVRFVYLGRFVDWKGVEFLVEAFALAVRRCHAELDLIGDGELFEATRRQVARLGIEASVTLHGRLPLARAREVIAASDVYMVPSLRECGGCALLEAMASAKPIIAANWAGPAEFLQEDSAILVDPSSRRDFIAGLADAMVQLVEAPELRERLGRAALARLRNHPFDWDRKTDRLIEIFRETLSRAKPRKESHAGCCYHEGPRTRSSAPKHTH